MDPLEMLTSPFKLTYRYSPLVHDLPAGLKRELRFIFGDHVTFDPGERSVANRDNGALPADLVDRVMQRRPHAVVVPRDRGDLVEALRLAERHGLPVTPRGNGTSTNGASVPAEGGIALDMRVFQGIGPLDRDAMTVACEAGATFEALRAFLEPHGLAPLVGPELPWASTVGGSVALGRHGFGSARHGSIAQQCVEATVLAPDRRLDTYTGESLALVRGMQGSTGFLLSVKLKVGPAQRPQPFLVQLDTHEQAAALFEALRAAKPWHLAVLSPSFAELRQEATGVKGLQEAKWHVLAVFDGDGDKARVEAAAQGLGRLLDDKVAQKEWGQRHATVSIHRLGPTVVRAEVLVPAAKLREALELQGLAKGRACTEALDAGQGWVLVRLHLLEDERRMEFPFALGNLYAVVDGARRLHGHAAYPSLLLAGEGRAAVGDAAYAKLAAFKAKRDPWEVMNPGKVWPSRMRGMPIASLPSFLRTQKPILKMLRGAVPYKGLEGERAGDIAVATTVGRAHSGEVAAHADELYACSHCGLCNTVSPDVGHWESLRMRGMVQLSKALLEGQGRWTEHVRDSAFRLPLHRAGDAVCPSRIPLLDAAVALRTEVARTLGPLAAHEAVAASVAKDNNPLGRPKAQRGAWLPEGFAPATDANVLYYAGCRASYERPLVARAGLELLAKTGPVTTLGAAEPCCGHTLRFTGQGEAAAKQAENAMKAILKAAPGIEAIVTCDPECARTMRESWPQVAADKGIAWTIQVKTASEHLLPLVGKGLALTSQVQESVHFTEPCASLDAHSLKLLQKVPGLQVQALPILPCGAPGAMREAHPDVAEACARKALEAALSAGAATIVTSSPLCEAHLADVGARAKKGVAVVDVLQLVARAAGIALPGEPAPGPAAPAAPAAAPAAAKPKLTPEELEARKKAALEKAAAMKAQKAGEAPKA